MQTYWARHGVHLDPDDTLVVCIDTIGWEHLVLRDGEGVLRIHRSPEALLPKVTDIAATAGDLSTVSAEPSLTHRASRRRADASP